MSDHDPKSEMPASAPQPGGRQRRAYIAATVAGVALIAAFASSSLGHGLGHRVLAQLPGLAVAGASLDGESGPGLAVGWHGGLFDSAIGPLVEAHADRMIRHLSVEIDATAEQQEKLRAIVRDAVKDLLPLREKVLAARATARELLTQQTIDRAAIEKFRADQIATHDAASKRLIQAVADAAEVLTPEQRRKISEMASGRRGHWGGGLWGHGAGRVLIWRN